MSGNVRNTKQKQAVYEALARLDHPTATEVYERVHAEHPGVSRGTVFRVLGGFAAGGQVHRVALTDSDMRFDTTLAPHGHGRCRVCGRVFDVFLPDLPALAQNAVCGGFHIDGCEVEFFGECDACIGKNMRQGANEE